MADIFHDLVIQATPASIFETMASSPGIDRWWTKRSAGRPEMGESYDLHFGEGYDWHARVSKLVADQAFELTMEDGDPDWQGTRIGFQLEEGPRLTKVRFYHRGWPNSNEGYRRSNFCWAMYLRLVKRWLEKGEEVPFDKRLSV